MPTSESTETWDATPPPVIMALADQLMPIFYEDLKRLAHRERSRVGAGETLRTTALVNEAYLKLRRSQGFNDDAHFLRAAALAIRQALINHAVRRLSEKRGGGANVLTLNAVVEVEVADTDDESLLALNDALAELNLHAPRLAQVVECRYFAGYSDVETARALGLSERTVRRDWTLARAWLHRSLSS